MEGWIKLHRKILENPVVCKDSDYFYVWCYLLLNATHEGYPVIFKGQVEILRPGQLLTGRKSLGEKLKINESKIQRILKAFENEQQIEQQTSNKNRLITILSWDEYQADKQQVNNKRTTNRQQMNTNKNDKNIKNDKNYIMCVEVIDYLNLKTKKTFKASTAETQKHISGRILDGYTLDDFKKVIDIKCKQWMNTDREIYLRPNTLFRPSNFENYRNECIELTYDENSDCYKLSKCFEKFLQSLDSKFGFENINQICFSFEQLVNKGRTPKEIYAVMSAMFKSGNRFMIKKYSDINLFCKEFDKVGRDLLIDSKDGE